MSDNHKVVDLFSLAASLFYKFGVNIIIYLADSLGLGGVSSASVGVYTIIYQGGKSRWESVQNNCTVPLDWLEG